MCLSKYMCTTCVHEPEDARRGYQILWSWNYRQLSACTIRMQETKPMSSTIRINVLLTPEPSPISW